MDSSSSNHVHNIAYLYENIILNEEDIAKSASNTLFGKQKPVPNPSDKGGVTVDAGPVKIGVTDPKTDIGKQTGDAIVKAAQNVGGAISGLFKGSQPPAAKSKPTPAGAKPQTVTAAGGKGGTVTVGKEYDAKLGGKAGKVTYDAKGQKSFKPSASAPAAAKTSPTSSTPSTPSDSWKPKTTGEAEWAKNFPKLAARLNPDGTQKGTGQSKIEKDAANIRREVDARQSQRKQGEVEKANEIIKSGKVASLNPKTDTVQSTQAAQKKSTAPVAAKASPTPTNDDLTDDDRKRIDDFKKLGALQKLGQRASVESDLAKMSPSRKQKVMDYYNKESYDAYDVVLEYLLSNGHVDTLDEALYVMMEMDAETIGTIVEDGFNSSGRYDVGGGRTVGPVAGAIRSLVTGNLPKSKTYVPPSKQTGVNRPPAVPTSKGDSGNLTDFGAGGGKTKMQQSGMTVGQVERQGRRNKGDYSG
jgi:hypothetical protein